MAFWNKKEKKELNEEEKAIQEEKVNWLKIIGFVAGAQFVILLLIAFGKVEANKYNQILIGLALLGLFALGVAINMIKKTVGLDFAIKLLKARRLKRKGYGILKEFTLAGRPQYHLVKFSDIIRYKTKYNGEDKQGLILYNPYAKYEDFGADIPMIEGTISDISPKNCFTGNRIGMIPDLADKIIVESSISQKDLDDVKKHRRWLTYLLIGIGVAGMLSFDLFAQRLSEANAQTLACYKELGREAVIVAQSVLLPALFRRAKEDGEDN